MRGSSSGNDGSTGYYLYDARGSVSGITNEEYEEYEEWKGYGGEYAERAEAREELRRYLIDENGNYDADRIKELFIESKGANIKYDYKTRRSEEAELFISSQ